MGAVGGMAQVNVRVDRQVKNRAEEALRLSGGSLPELIKKVVAKVAQGGGQCEEVLAAGRRPGSRPSRPILRSPHHGRRRISFTRTWASLRHPYPMIAIGTRSIPKAMDEHYRQKGMIQ